MSNRLIVPIRRWPAFTPGHPLARDLVGYWLFWEGQGPQVADVGNPWDIGNHGTWNGTGSHWAASEMGTCGSFNGVDDYVSAPGTPALPADVTLSMWVRPADVSSGQYISDFKGGDEFAVIVGYVNGFYNTYGGSYPTNNGADTQILASGVGIWDCLTWVKSGSNLRGYLNGSAQCSVTITHGDFSPSAGINIGVDATLVSQWYEGLIGGYSIYQRALSGSDVQQLYLLGRRAGLHRRRVFPVAAAAGNPWWYYQHTSLGVA